MHQLSISARRIWSDSICGGFGHKTATGHSSFERISKGRKNSNQNCELACELKPADRQKVIQSLLGESCELNCEIMISQSLS